MRSFLKHIKITCTDCGFIYIKGGGYFSYLTGKIFSEDQVPKVVVDFNCLYCSSKKLNFYNDMNKAIILHGLSRVCTNCTNYIPDNFVRIFAKSNFCPDCILSEKINDQITRKNLYSKKNKNTFRDIASYVGKSGIEKDYWIKKEADFGDASSSYEYGWYLSDSNYNEYLEIAEKYLVRALDLHDKKMNFSHVYRKYAELLLNPNYVNKDAHKAILLFKEAAKLDDELACEQLGRIYLDGIHVERDELESFKYFKQADSYDFPFTHIKLVLWIMYYRGIGIKKDIEIANQYLYDAIDNYANNRYRNRDFDTKEIFDQCIQIVNGVNIISPNNSAQLFINDCFLFPFKDELLNFCGGKIVKNFSHNKIILSKLLFKNSNKCEKIYKMESINNFSYSEKYLGQIERFEKNFWIAVDSNGIAFDVLFLRFRDAVNAISEHHKLKLPIEVCSYRVR